MSTPVSKIHDSYFKWGMSDPELACTFLREYLPLEVVSLLGPEPPEPLPGTFVDENLRQHHSDVLFRLHLKARRDAFAYVLVEHKSSPDPGARLQLLRYIVRLLTDLYEQNRRRLPLPLVLPMLVHQGPEGWKHSCEFTDLFGIVPAPLQPYLPSFRHAMLDLASIDNARLSSEVRLRNFLRTLQLGRHPDLNSHFGILFSEVSALPDMDVFRSVAYIESGPIPIDKKLFREALRRHMPEREERIMGWLTEPYYEQGIAEGEARGEAKTLVRVLEMRFGALPLSDRQRIFSADSTSIDAWIERVLTVPDLHSIFDQN